MTIRLVAADDHPFVLDGLENLFRLEEDFQLEARSTNGEDLISGPVVTCTGSGLGGVNCLPANQPATPTAPSSNVLKLTPYVATNACNFWSGNALELLEGGPKPQYTLSETINGLNGKGNWKFEWTYEIGFVDGNAGPFDPRTAWDLQSSSTTCAAVTVEGFFAGQSTQKKSKGTDKWTFKASHMMTNPDGTTRLVDPLATVYDGLGNPVGEPLVIYTGRESGVDFFYQGNAGVNGSTSQLINDTFVSAIQQGLVSSPGGNTDNFAGNDYTNGERAWIVYTEPAAVEICDAGAYEMLVTRVLKGVEGSLSLPFSTTGSICVSAGDCQLCQQ